MSNPGIGGVCCTMTHAPAVTNRRYIVWNNPLFFWRFQADVAFVLLRVQLPKDPWLHWLPSWNSQTFATKYRRDQAATLDGYGGTDRATAQHR
jgi:hypothetical protein